MATRSTSRPVDRSLSVVEPVAEGACCAACAVQQAPARLAVSVTPPVRPPITVVESVRPMRPPIARDVDRRITLGGVLLAASLLGLAGLGTIALAFGGTVWLPLHIGLAGAAGTAIAAVLPFFTTALGRVAPAGPALRTCAIGLVAGGALLATLGISRGWTGVAAGGGAAYLAGLVAVAAAAFLPLRATIGFRLRLVHLAYGGALAQVAVGVGLVTISLAGWPPVAEAWTQLKPAHAWLNVFGFVIVVVAASLVHLAPTVAGARIRRRRSADVALACLVSGPPLVAIGYAAGWDPAGLAGALLEVAGAVALVSHGAAVQRDRGRWTSDGGWHRFTGLSLFAAPIWLLVAVAIASGRIVALGAAPASWSVGPIAVPLLAGGIVQVLIGSWTHIVPAIGPGDPAAHASQRRWLGRGATARWLAWNAGTALLTAGILTGTSVLVSVGAALLGLGLVAAFGVLAVAVAVTSSRAPAAAVAARP